MLYRSLIALGLLCGNALAVPSVLKFEQDAGRIAKLEAEVKALEAENKELRARNSLMVKAQDD